jgi:hypothetical protein
MGAGQSCVAPGPVVTASDLEELFLAQERPAAALSQFDIAALTLPSWNIHRRVPQSGEIDEV